MGFEAGFENSCESEITFSLEDIYPEYRRFHTVYESNFDKFTGKIIKVNIDCPF